MTDLFSSVNINTSFQRSARIDNKISKDFLDNFVFHDTSKKVLNQISSSLLNSNQSGFTLTGPYGTGKSSLALFLKALIAKDNSIKKQAEKIANFNNKHLFSRVFLNKKKSHLSEESLGRLEKNPLRILDSKNSEDLEIVKECPKINSFFDNADFKPISGITIPSAVKSGRFS